MQQASKDNYGEIDWSIILMWDSDQAQGLDYSLQWFGTGFLDIEYDRLLIEYRLGERELKHFGR